MFAVITMHGCIRRSDSVELELRDLHYEHTGDGLDGRHGFDCGIVQIVRGDDREAGIFQNLFAHFDIGPFQPDD